MRFKVQAIERDGFKFYMRAGHAWPRGDQGYREVETVDSDADQPTAEGEPLRIGRVNFAAISNDKQMRVAPSDLSVTSSDLLAELAVAKARIGELEAELAAARADEGDEEPEAKPTKKGK